ncbi:hypothetical protein CAPTEDRAFT_153190 [Capitella teleta]|uniref:Large ribosomal subunit protein mL43 n=1 Tax=Capitella teleta TaxID=283909 RepID=R7V0Z1_CAPTE|nr:hypothetical protein CAPTEDRAFT_153190 [Capitella teleta]|eukprot:ELU09371.1 hypothetical protein CAPTEDRAFT_153190 [Capitella teleta]
MPSRVTPSSYLRNVLQNGVGRYVCQLQRVTLSFCKSTNPSRGARDFIENHLLEFTRNNPGVVIYLDPKRHHSPKLCVEYLNGRTETMSIDRYPAEDICQWLDHFRTRSGVQINRLRKNWHTDTPSIQGTWTPATNRPTSWNVTEFPCQEISRRLPDKETATERILSAAKALREGSPTNAAIGKETEL